MVLSIDFPVTLESVLQSEEVTTTDATSTTTTEENQVEDELIAELEAQVGSWLQNFENNLGQTCLKGQKSK